MTTDAPRNNEGVNDNHMKTSSNSNSSHINNAKLQWTVTNFHGT